MAERLENMRDSGVEPGMASLRCYRARGGCRCLSADFGQEDLSKDLTNCRKINMLDV